MKGRLAPLLLYTIQSLIIEPSIAENAGDKLS
jgi:hypothetical protein